jgi:hypothetical protein
MLELQNLKIVILRIVLTVITPQDGLKKPQNSHVKNSKPTGGQGTLGKNTGERKNLKLI